MSDRAKWLLLIPAIVVVVALGYFVPKLLGVGSDDNHTLTQDNQAVESSLNDIQQHINSYQGLLAKNPSDLEVLRSMGDAYLDLGETQSDNNKINESYESYKKSIDYYRKYLALKPSDLEVQIDLGLAYAYLQMPEIAERELKAVVQAAPDNQRAWHSLGWVEQNGLGNTDEARKDWQTSVNLDPNSDIGKASKSYLDQLSSPQNELTVPPAP